MTVLKEVESKWGVCEIYDKDAIRTIAKNAICQIAGTVNKCQCF